MIPFIVCGANDQGPKCPNGGCSEESGLSQVTHSATFTFLTDAIFYDHALTKFKFILRLWACGRGEI